MGRGPSHLRSGAFSPQLSPRKLRLAFELEREGEGDQLPPELGRVVFRLANVPFTLCLVVANVRHSSCPVLTGYPLSFGGPTRLWNVTVLSFQALQRLNNMGIAGEVR